MIRYYIYSKTRAKTKKLKLCWITDSLYEACWWLRFFQNESPRKLFWMQEYNIPMLNVENKNKV